MEEIKTVKTTIDQDCRLVFGGMIERLKSAEGHKVSVLQHDMSSIQQEIDTINGIIQEFTHLTNDGVTPLQFMVKAGAFRQNIEYILGRGFKTEIDIFPYDLPREMFHIRSELEEAGQLESLLQMKDRVVWDLFHRIKNVAKESVTELESTANQEISSWAVLTDKYASDLKEFQRICFYCAEPMNEESLNTDCAVNIDKAIVAANCSQLLTSQRLHGQAARAGLPRHPPPLLPLPPKRDPAVSRSLREPAEDILQERKQPVQAEPDNPSG